MSKTRPVAGVTLIELLIAVTLVGLVAAAVLTSIRVGINAMDKANARLLSNRRVMGAQRILVSQIGAVMAVVAGCRVDPSAPPQRRLFFQGEPESMRFVSSYSLSEAYRGRPKILEFQVIPGENNQGVRLVVNELPYTGPDSAGMLCLPGNRYRPIEVGPQSFVLADRLAFCRFSFREHEPGGRDGPQWLPVWREPLLPAGVRVEMSPLDPDRATLPMVTFTVPMRVDKDPMEPVLDDYASWRN
jgi:prepilin-type N-terminal cleavage/methylation domain-containing protein